jgi:RNA polymerase sigma factor (sigma-70 family)
LTDLVRQLRVPDAGTDRDLLDRYLTLHDQEAFEILVKRHQRTVLSACQHVLPDADVEDVFQATFLILLSQAKAARWQPSLGGWLYSVAHRVAVRTRRTDLRRARREARVAVPEEAPPPHLDLSWREAAGALHEELDRLPDRHRLPLLLCYLEGLSRDEAATQLGWTPGTIRGRLARGRQVLRQRLARRGIACSVGLLAAVGQPGVATAAAPDLIVTTVRAGRGGGYGRALQLARPFLPGSGLRVKTVPGMVAMLVLGLGLVAGETAPKEPARPAGLAAVEQKKDEVAPPDPEKEFRYAGSVLDPAGKPLAGATVHICGLRHGYIEFKPRVKTGADGKFDFTVNRDEFDTKDRGGKPGSRVVIGATAPGFGAVSAFATEPGNRDKLVLWLPEEQVVTARVTNTEGKPIAGAKIGYSLLAGKLDQNGKPVPCDARVDTDKWMPNYLPYLDQGTDKTDKDGRMTLRGVAKGWIYSLTISGPGIQTLQARLVGRPQKPETVGGTGLDQENGGAPKLTLYGSEFTHVAGPDRLITGVVRDKATGKPLANISVGRTFVADPEPPLWATTDGEGKFRLEGVAPGRHELRVDPDLDTPYLRTRFQIDTTEGKTPFECTLELLRQRVITGRVKDQATGKPVSGTVEYRALASNPNLKEGGDLAQPHWLGAPLRARIDKEGKFVIPALVGRGVLLVEADGAYRPARLSDADRKVIPIHPQDAALLDTKPFPVLPSDFHAVRAAELPAEGGDLAIDLTVDAGRSAALDIKYPGNKPGDTWVLGVTPMRSERMKEYDPQVDRVGGLKPGEPRHVFAIAPDGAFGCHRVLTGNETDSVTLEMKPTGGITGRLVDPEGKPLVGQSFQLYYENGADGVFLSEGFSYRLPTEAEAEQRLRIGGIHKSRFGRFSMAEVTDSDGKFRINKLIPGVNFDLWVVRTEPSRDPKSEQVNRRIVGYVKVTRTSLKAGETKDLGDLVVNKAE